MKRRRRKKRNPAGSTVLWVLAGLGLFALVVGYPLVSVGMGRLKAAPPSS